MQSEELEGTTSVEMTVSGTTERLLFSPQPSNQLLSDADTNSKMNKSTLLHSPRSSSTEEESKEDNPFRHLQEQTSAESVHSWLQRITQMQHTGDVHKRVEERMGSSSSTTKATRVVTYEDLPYMGEMTLDNTKPRRGRKPKKADICHLIYKNYGTVFPGSPTDLRETGKKSPKKDNATTTSTSASHHKGSVQNKIISSLLEKRLTQQESRKRDPNPDEPLNLCIKDLNHLKIRLMSKGDEIKSEAQSDDDVEFVNESSSSISSLDTDPRLLTPGFGDGTPLPDLFKGSENGTPPSGYVYWPNAGVFIHPMALQQHLMYYQRLAGNSGFPLPPLTPKPTADTTPLTKPKPLPELRKIAPKLRPKKEETKDDQESSTSSIEKPKRNAPCTSTTKTPTKRKRSAIFIPPIPAENQTNPATEVSICKFKFTGGAKPTLQEKKMLSVDSGGNFRYYSGTGDKSMRGYEFFPRETLQQQVGNAHGSSTGAFLQASGEKIYPPPVDFTGKQRHPDLLLPTDTPSSSSTASFPGAASEATGRHKKRKSRKSLQRERLEQTFKEKGFLIQTQQLESAEGATYCKFRQLRKFTRYLFRSWKDYLPGNVRELNEGEEEEPDGEMDELGRFVARDHTPTNFNATL